MPAFPRAANLDDAIRDAEAAILGGILIRNDLLVDLNELEPDDFVDLKHRKAFEAIRNLEADAKPIDVLTLELQLEAAGVLDAVGGVEFLGLLCLRVPTAENVLLYAGDVQRASLLRKVALAAEAIAQRARTASHDEADDVLDSAIADLARLDRKKPDDAKPIRQVVLDRVRQLEAIADAKAAGAPMLTGVPTGIAELDAKLGGWQLGIVNLLAARPAMGKSSTAISSADAASAAGYGAHVFSLEDSEQAYADRSLSRHSQVPAEKLRQADITTAEAGQLARALGKLAQRSNWLLDARGGLTASEIIRNVRRHRRALNTKLVVVDYIQLVARRKGGERLNENDALAEIMTEFSDAAKADKIAYLVLCQLNREVEKRVDKRPVMSDLRGSGALEERSKIIVGQYRGAVYSKNPKRDVDYDCDCDAHVISCIVHRPRDFEAQVQLGVIKNSNGRTGRVFATWNGPTTEIW